MAEGSYSERWFETFAAAVSDDQITRDVDGVSSCLSPAPGGRVLEIGCGLGRHASQLVARGFEVVAIDQSPLAVAAARRQTPAAEVRQLDMRHLRRLDGRFDACFSLWHAFGYFNAATNERVLADTARLLGPGGRLVLELFNPAWVRAHQGTTRHAGRVSTQHVRDDRQIVQIEYADGQQDRFSWQLYTPDQLAQLAAPYGLQILATGTWWDFTQPPTQDHARFQIVLCRTCDAPGSPSIPSS